MLAVSVQGCAWLLAVSTLSAHQDPGIHWLDDVRSDALAVVVAWPGGFDGGGIAAALAECRWQRAKAASPGITQSGVRVFGDVALVHVVASPQQWQDVEAFVRALLDDALPLADDTLALAAAKVALAADDAAFLYPGQVLAWRARAHFGVGTAWNGPVAGDPLVLQAATPAVLRRELAAAAPATVFVAGAVPQPLRDAVATAPWRSGALAAASASVPDAIVGRTLQWEPHERIDAPFVAAAFVVAPTDRAAFAVAAEVARARAHRRFGTRQSGLLARAPFVDWSWLGGDSIALFHRRGADPVQRLPGEPAGRDEHAAGADAAAELQAWLRDLTATPPTVEECDAARRSVQAELDLIPELAAEPVGPTVLGGRVMVRALRGRRGIDAAVVASVDAAAVGAVLQRTLAPERAFWHGLLPLPRTDRNWPAR